MSDGTKPLSGIHVIDLTQILQGPYCAFLMAVPESHGHSVLTAIGREDRKGHPDYNSDVMRGAREQEINSMIEAWTRQRTRDEARCAGGGGRYPEARALAQRRTMGQQAEAAGL